MNNELLTESHLPNANTVFCWSVSGTFGVGRESQIAIRAMSSQLKMLLVVPDQVASQMPQGHEGYLAKVHSHDRTRVAGCLPWARGVSRQASGWRRSRPSTGSETANLSSECVTSTVTPGTGDNTGGLPGKNS